MNENSQPLLAIEDSKKLKIKLGEIFTYEVDNEGEKETVSGFFFRVHRDYYLINTDEGYLGFFDEIAGMKYKGNPRQGKDPFNFKECLEYFKLKKIKKSGKFIFGIDQKKSVLLTKNVKDAPIKDGATFTTNWLNLGNVYTSSNGTAYVNVASSTGGIAAY